MNYIFVFKKKDTYYYKVKGLVYYWTHPIGYKNQYNHEIILIIPISNFIDRKRNPLKYYKNKVITSLIRLLKKINRD